MMRPLPATSRYYTATSRRLQNVFHSQTEDPSSSAILSSLKKTPRVAQTLTEKIVQQYAVGLPKDKFVKAGDYITVSPHYCMTRM
jgi:homoaconitate hydratase